MKEPLMLQLNRNYCFERAAERLSEEEIKLGK